ncbi:hypothetical protein LCGC14_2448230 [marine sediment metagenome]|uniref:Uncharacterized protein n=1 Tax=marine sediment metagenome TaxID=412755 RepID=A0A0F9C4F9_9ZZZZ
MSEELDFKVFTRRHGKYDAYKITRIPNGWNVKFLVHSGNCNPKGEPYLYDNFRQDYICYPNKLPDILELLWQYADDLTRNELQDKINEIAEWVSVCERAHPSWNDITNNYRCVLNERSKKV